MATKSEFQNKTNCINFDECPLCYKCRGFKSGSNKCIKCSIEVCDRPTHTPKNINMMITKETINVKEKVIFKSFPKE